MKSRSRYGRSITHVTTLLLTLAAGCVPSAPTVSAPGASSLSDAGSGASELAPQEETTRSDALELSPPPPPPRVHLRCETATVVDGVRWLYRTSWFALEGDPMSLEVSRDARVQGALRLTPRGDGVWSSERVSVTLEPRITRDGAILLAPRVVHTVPGAVVQARSDNGFCIAESPSCARGEVGVCSGGPSGPASCGCLAAGIAPLDPVGQAVIGLLTGGPLRWFARGVLGLLGSGAARLLGAATTAGVLSLLVSSSARPDEHAALELWIARELVTRRDETITSLVALRSGEVRVLGESRPSLGELLAATRLRGSPLTLARDGAGRWGVVAGSASAPWRSIVVGTPRPSDPATLSESVVIVEERDRRAGALLAARRDLRALVER
jgi:hypothetical protein